MSKLIRKLAPRTYWKHRLSARHGRPGNASRYRAELKAAELWEEVSRRR